MNKYPEVWCYFTNSVSYPVLSINPGPLPPSGSLELLFSQCGLAVNKRDGALSKGVKIINVANLFNVIICIIGIK
jgi:hypothetical protein